MKLLPTYFMEGIDQLTKELPNIIRNGNILRLKELIRADKQIVNEKFKANQTPLMEAIIFKQEEIAKLLVENGADVNAQDDKGWSALHFAAQSYLPNTIKLLITKKADIDPQDAWGNTPLLRAIYNSNNGETIRLLLEAGADRNKKNNYGHSPLEIAQKVDDHKIIKYFEITTN